LYADLTSYLLSPSSTFKQVNSGLELGGQLKTSNCEGSLLAMSKLR